MPTVRFGAIGVTIRDRRGDALGAARLRWALTKPAFLVYLPEV